MASNIHHICAWSVVVLYIYLFEIDRITRYIDYILAGVLVSRCLVAPFDIPRSRISTISPNVTWWLVSGKIMLLCWAIRGILFTDIDVADIDAATLSSLIGYATVNIGVMMVPAWYDSPVTFYSTAVSTIIGLIAMQTNNSILHHIFVQSYTMSLTYSYMNDSVYSGYRYITLISMIPAIIVYGYTQHIYYFAYSRAIGLIFGLYTTCIADFKNTIRLILDRHHPTANTGLD
jgi:hypothetical protein